jgi:hypothetical protein
MKVYVWYELVDRDAAQKIIDLYKSLEIEVLVLSDADRANPNRDRIAAELVRRADVTVYLFSRESLSSGAKASEKLLLGAPEKIAVPVVIGDVPDSALPSALADRRIFRLEEPESLATVVQETNRKEVRASDLQRVLPRSQQLFEVASLVAVRPEVPHFHMPVSEITVSSRGWFGNLARRREGVTSVSADPSAFGESIAWALGYALGQVAVFGGVIAIGYTYWKEIGSLVGSLLSLFKGSLGAIPVSGLATREDADAPIDKLECCVFSAPTVQPRARFQVQVAFFSEKYLGKVTSEIKKFDIGAVRKKDSVNHTLSLAARRGSYLSVTIDPHGLIICKRPDPVRWNGTYGIGEFLLEVPDGNVGFTYTPQVYIWVGGEYVGRIFFRLPCVSSKETSVPQLLGGGARGREPIFFSYSEKDLDLVRRKTDVMFQLNMNIFDFKRRDVLGNKVAKVITRKIDNCNTFFVFWSHNAAKSAFVEMEYERARKRHDGSELQSPAIIRYGVPTIKFYRKYPWIERTVPRSPLEEIAFPLHERCRVRDS